MSVEIKEALKKVDEYFSQKERIMDLTIKACGDCLDTIEGFVVIPN